jgi:hypothetical protein
MNIIKEQRELIIQDNNTAQTSLEYILENANKQTDTLFIKDKLHGDLDFKIIKEMGFGQLTNIIIREGEITSIANLPQGILLFECTNNLLINIENLPNSLQTLKLDYNYIDDIDISYLTKLNLFNISHNKLSNIERLPKSLITINIQNNVLNRINLDGLNHLKQLNFSNNQVSIVDNLPNNIIELSYDNNPTFEFRNKNEIVELPKNVKTMEDDVKLKYIEALHEYFKLKNKYMNDWRELKRKIFNNSRSKKVARQKIALIQMPCIKCKRNVGTIFQTKDNRHIAICGDKASPCNLNIQLFNGEDTVPILELLSDLKISTDEIKMSIIQHKLDTLFNYISEEESIKLYKTELDNFFVESSLYKDYLDRYNELYNNINNKELIDKKNGEIFKLIETNREILKEYSNSSNESNRIELMQNVMHTQIQQILPETRNISSLKYDISEIIEEEIKPDVFIHTLHQEIIDPRKNYVYINEPPRVIHFVK